MKAKCFITITLLMVVSVQAIWAQKVVLYPTGKEPIEYEIAELDSITFIDAEPFPAFLACPDDNHPHAIDLGLPSGTKWCCCNVGASSPEDYGGYYAWGETSEKSVYNQVTYKYYNGQDENGDGTIEKNFSVVNIGSNIAGTQYDVAHVRMGSPWRMPSVEQMWELIKNSSRRQWTQQNGVNGILFTGPSGGQIFLPAAGYRWGDDLYNAGSSGYYRSSSDSLDYGNDAYWMHIDLNTEYLHADYSYYRQGCYGRSVRAVRP